MDQKILTTALGRKGKEFRIVAIDVSVGWLGRLRPDSSEPPTNLEGSPSSESPHSVLRGHSCGCSWTDPLGVRVILLRESWVPPSVASPSWEGWCPRMAGTAVTSLRVLKRWPWRLRHRTPWTCGRHAARCCHLCPFRTTWAHRLGNACQECGSQATGGGWDSPCR